MNQQGYARSSAAELICAGLPFNTESWRPMSRRVVIACWIAVALSGGAGMPRAQAPATAPQRTIDAFDTTFRDWMQENGVARGTLAVVHQNRLVFARGYGGQDPAERVLLASLSKAITGRCVAVLIVDGRLRFDSTVGDVLAPFFKQHGEPADPRLKAATVEQLLVHRAGFPPAPRDLMTPAAAELLQTAKSPATATPAELLVATLTAPLAAAPGETFRYANIGYLALGVMIESVTGESYERFCGREVLERAGITAPALDPAWRAFSSFGGWRLSGVEYMAFLARDRVDELLWAYSRLPAGPSQEQAAQRAARLLAFLLDPHRRHAATGAPAGWVPAWYALGQFTAQTAPASDARLAWHAGSWGVAPETIGMLAAQHQRGASWFVWYTQRPGKDATDALLERLAALPATIGAWPEYDLFPGRGLGSRSVK